LQDVLGGQVPITVIPLSGALAHIQSGRLKVLAVSSATRSPELPQVPTFDELGYKQLTVVSWLGLSAPKGTPPDIVAKLNAAVRASLEKPEVRSKLEADGGTPMAMSAEQFTQLVKSDTECWGQLTRSINLKAN
jgi:tripartite-type tricarboxylate transporter receptor subunit TctC